MRVGAMGDVLHALPALAALRQALPGAEIGWAVEPRWGALLADSLGQGPLGLRLHAVESRLWKRQPLSGATLRSLVALRAGLRGQRYDVGVDLQGSMRSAVIGRVAGARAFFGPARPREAPARLLYGQRVETTAVHVVDQAAELVAAAVGLPLVARAVELPRDEAAEAWWRRSQPVVGEGPLVLLVPQAGWGAKRWPAARFGALARELQAGGARVLVNRVGPADALAAEVMAAAGGTARAIEADLAQLIALTRRVALVVAGDTGPLHLAAALGRPVVALFGPTDPARTGPYGAPSRVLRHATSVTDHGRYTATEGGLLQITTEEVLRAATELLAQQREGAGE